MGLRELEQESINLLREAKAVFNNLCVLWSTGKDSTLCLYLCKKAFFGKIPFPVVHLDTGYKFKEMYKFRDRLAKDGGFKLLVAKSDKRMSPEKDGKLACCTELKTNTLRRLMKEKKFDAVIVGIRRDEHGARNKERLFSPRDKNFEWKYREQPPEAWGLLSNHTKNHMRIHPLLGWTESDVWEYIKKERLPVNKLYFAVNGKRHRSLGCTPCTKPVKSNASTVKEIIKELKKNQSHERDGRAQDKEEAFAMQKLRAMGYM